MNRTYLYNYIEEKLIVLATKLKLRGKLNILDLNIHSEMFFSDLLELVYDYKLVNLNTYKPNAEGIDLIDKEKKIIAQVSSTCSKKKVEDSLNKEILTEYQGYRFKFISIADDATNLRNKTFTNPYGILFSPVDDILDIFKIMNIVIHKSINEQEKIYSFIKKELGTELEGINFTAQQSSYASEFAENMKDVFVKTNIFDTGLEVLKHSNILILEGQSGIGKTSTAMMIANSLVSKSNFSKLTSIDGSDKLGSKSIEDFLKSLKKSAKEDEVIIFDDFLGKTKLNGSEDYLLQIEELLKFMKQCKTKKIVFTTRTTIFENSKKLNESLAQFFEYDTKVLSVSEEYVIDDRINIFGKYILKNDIKEKIGFLLNDKKTLYATIQHVNFSPLIIERATSDCKSKEPEQIGETILNHLDNPNFIWEKEVSALDNNALNYIFVLYSLSDTFVEQRFVDECFEKFNKTMGIKKIEDLNDTKRGLKALLSYDNGNNISFRHPSIIDYLSKKIYQVKENLISSAVFYEQIERLDETKEEINRLLLNPQEFFELKVLPFKYMNDKLELPNTICISYLKSIFECNFQNKQYENIINEVLKIVFQHGHILLMWASEIVINTLNLKYFNMSEIINNEKYMEMLYRASNSENIWELIQVTEEKDEQGYDFDKMKKYVQTELLRKLEDTASWACEEEIASCFETYMNDSIDNYSDEEDYEVIACEIINNIIEDIDAVQIGRESMKKIAKKIGLYNVNYNSVDYDLYNHESLVDDYAINLIEEYFLYK
ncbi:SMEK domain-containing protein [Paenibacillus sp. 2TAF8]|jgi:DNA polymerase III delta prime subunit|uniref:SMEK domain-containing protein n=1 Tax=Paenibacillus sp. 2TAF8 TaxID=3233020 RepID=UPI003F98F3F9